MIVVFFTGLAGSTPASSGAAVCVRGFMSRASITPTGRPAPFGDEELIVSKTDLKGRITYANSVFTRVAGYRLDELLGRPHSLIRHPAMPRCVFKLLWDTIEAKKEIFAYVINMAKSGDHYWVFAHVTPSLDASGNVVGFHSNRRKPEPAQIEKIKPVYEALLAEENAHADRKAGMSAGYNKLLATLAAQKVGYDEFVFSL
jgi:PAS domain S-box-containing protein